MNRVKILMLGILALLLSPLVLQAQLSTVVVVDFERAVVESQQGKKASEKFNATLQAKQGEIEKRQKELDDQQKKLQNGARTLSDQAKGDLQKDIDRRTRELQRLNEDAQKELQGLRDELLRPIAERATAVLQAMAAEKGYTLVVDVSNQESIVLYVSEKSEITAELIKRIDAAMAEEGSKTEAPKPSGTPPANRPGVTPPAPRPTTQAPNAPKPSAPAPTPPKP
jgi:outer membrane protein